MWHTPEPVRVCRYYKVVGESRCPISDTYWQTETGAHVLAPLPGVWPQPPGSATLPFFGVQPVVLDEQVRYTLLAMHA